MQDWLTPAQAMQAMEEGEIAVIIDKEAKIIDELKPRIVVDCILAKRNIGTTIDDAELVIGVGPGFIPAKRLSFLY